ncbi:amidohydrolase family protein [Mycobacterium heckeshornense]|uniref:Amidohydrolase n=1 Tax=Mycobacterium heckeshornense TaxID=110505 RepID=A0A2I3ELF0_9MYCO|nr:amidohydrolase family protein [Mycobacterium heckeshornense]KMV20807.1 metal-dependent hydrolase [Mycobacterium heckeshornense]MCV7033302.1 amidohydrolase family protein [Mycobacterium heckeshornense]BCO36270.1 amidohydrolase [Mycobacterium heckeshornense]
MTGTDQPPVLDVDQHYYEPLDAFTRHCPKEWGERTVQTAVIDGRIRQIVGGKIDRTVTNPTFDPIVKPGAMMEYFRGNPQKRSLLDILSEREPIPSHYRNRDDRLAKMDEQGLQAVWLLPSLAMGYEEGLQYDPPAAAQAFKAFNRWLLDDWGYNYKDRIFSSPYLAFGDIPTAVAEVEHGLDNGARIFVVRPQATYTDGGWRSPGDKIFDPIWARVHEAGAVVVVHIGEVGGAGLDKYVEHRGNIIGDIVSPLEIAVGHERAIANYLAALTCDKLFERFPDLKIASVENGAEFLPLLLSGLNRAGFQRPGYFASDPVEQFREHVWVSPFWEDNLVEVVKHLGVDHVLFGSDYPHPEGLAEPRQYEKVAAELNDPVGERKVMWDNAAKLTKLA